MHAVKVQPSDQLSPRHLETLKREIQCHKSMDHVNIVKLHEVVVWNGAVFLVQELMEGGDVAELLLRRGPLPEADIVLLLRSVLSAVCELHDKGSAHQDLKPANVLLPAPGAARPAHGVGSFTGGAFGWRLVGCLPLLFRTRYGLVGDLSAGSVAWLTVGLSVVASWKRDL